MSSILIGSRVIEYPDCRWCDHGPCERFMFTKQAVDIDDPLYATVYRRFWQHFFVCIEADGGCGRATTVLAWPDEWPEEAAWQE